VMTLHTFSILGSLTEASVSDYIMHALLFCVNYYITCSVNPSQVGISFVSVRIVSSHAGVAFACDTVAQLGVVPEAGTISIEENSGIVVLFKVSMPLVYVGIVRYLLRDT